MIAKVHEILDVLEILEILVHHLQYQDTRIVGNWPRSVLPASGGLSGGSTRGEDGTTSHIAGLLGTHLSRPLRKAVCLSVYSPSRSSSRRRSSPRPSPLPPHSISLSRSWPRLPSHPSRWLIGLLEYCAPRPRKCDNVPLLRTSLRLIVESRGLYELSLVIF